MRFINYYEFTLNTHRLLLAMEGSNYIFFGSYDGGVDELFEWFGHADIEYSRGNKEDFIVALNQFKAYQAGTLTQFSLPLAFEGTELQKDVWKTLQTIPYGSLMSYKEIASAIGRPSAVRAVASSIGKNPLLIIIPCHRVIGSDGKLRGYRGGIAMKQELLNHENALSQNKNGTH